MTDDAAAVPTGTPGGKAYYVTTPIYYVNDAPHIGHAYTTVAGDVLARWHRQRGEDVWFLTGTDEHGQKIMRSRRGERRHPAGVGRQAGRGRVEARAGDASTSPTTTSSAPPSSGTRSGCASSVQTLYDEGDIYEGEYEGPYCVGCEEYKLPGRAARRRRRRRPSSARSTSRPVEMLSGEELLLPAQRRTPTGCSSSTTTNPDFVQPESARNEVVSFVKQGLQDLSISRSTFDWGIPVPWDETHVLYVWIDALLNYVTAVGYGTDPERFARALAGRRAPGRQGHPALPRRHLAGDADGRRPRAAAQGLRARLAARRRREDEQVEADRHHAAGQITDDFGSDAFRYYFLRAIAFGQDGSFSWEDLSARYKAELATSFGNLASRVTAMVGTLLRRRAAGARSDEPVLARGRRDRGRRRPRRRSTGSTCRARSWRRWTSYARSTTTSPSRSRGRSPRTSRQRRPDLRPILYAAAEALRAVAVLLQPGDAEGQRDLWESLGAEAALGAARRRSGCRTPPAGASCPAGATVTKGEPLFPRIEEPEQA